MEIIVKIEDAEFDISSLFEGLDLNSDVKIDSSDLNGEFLKQAQLAAAYGYLSAEAEKHEKIIDYNLEVLAATLDKDVRLNFERTGKKTTETKIRNEVIVTQEYKELKLKLIDARHTKQVFKATCLALNHKLQALINAGADQRKTFVEPRLLEQE